jgi:hypothetical protein
MSTRYVADPNQYSLPTLGEHRRWSQRGRKTGPLCKVKLWKAKGDTSLVRTEKAGVGGSTPSLATTFQSSCLNCPAPASVRSQSVFVWRMAENRS